MSEFIKFVPDKVKAIEMQRGRDVSLDVRAVVETRGGTRVLLTRPGENAEIVIAKHETITAGGIVRSFRARGERAIPVYYKLVRALEK